MKYEHSNTLLLPIRGNVQWLKLDRVQLMPVSTSGDFSHDGYKHLYAAFRSR